MTRRILTALSDRSFVRLRGRHPFPTPKPIARHAGFQASGCRPGRRTALSVSNPSARLRVGRGSLALPSPASRPAPLTALSHAAILFAVPWCVAYVSGWLG